ncbi:MAG: LysM peptidoglycan-binding domain-containing protein [Gammaproteobacteria bacterium]|nr:LysM peptidoglycan-binding domain-containing protein [Gammaproteobacteria bacterium]MXY89534.1 LysM peptidoglycan-binding domain-containing protein [Gammaproteobacteria bacterium]MYE28235.1 LysM peptidoglycan-binding domain-containing protein [Gammaproteobacteria bacterium]MYF01162.1 LysM peptidoglycan-binding domain-containing protein [Gammaproteobacteria bacterium]MYG96855.1 LysM peptidoglycan-binding domain-containing protein [Gammaproteobacteria bacterium]
MIFRKLAILAVIFAASVSVAQAQTLRGSRDSVQRQYDIAVRDGFDFVASSSEISGLVESGQLLRVVENRNLILHDVSNPYARPAVKLLLDRLSAQYRRACGEQLTVTSLLRPQNRQPANAASNSVHPAGMAVDLRIPDRGRCRSWLEQTLLSLEGSGVLDVTRERWPPHYHVAVFTTPYQNYVAALTDSNREYRVRRGDSLWEIAQTMGVSLAQLRAVNGISGDLINIGQRLQIPAIASNTAVSAGTTIDKIEYTVRRGDSLWRIARRYNTSVAQIMRQNNLNSDVLEVNQVLQITPGSSS